MNASNASLATHELHDFVTIVSGLPRSGTSSMMQMLQAGGMPLMTDGLRTADASNPRGYLEYEPVKRLRTDRSWLPAARGRAVKIIHLLLRDLLLDGSLRFRVVFMERPIAEVLASQQAMLVRDGRPPGDAALLRRAFESQLSQLHDWLAAQPDISVIRVAYHEALHDPRSVARDVAHFLGRDLDIEAMVAAIDPALHRQRA